MTKAYLQNNVPPFVVFGVSKSGTTWIQQTINAHPEICCHFQRRIFPLCGELRSRLRSPLAVIRNAQNSPFGGLFANKQSEQEYRDMLQYVSQINLLQPDYVEKILRGSKEHAADALFEVDYQVVTSLVQNVLRIGTDKKFVGTKVYTDLAQLFRYFPDSKVVHIVRDGRDVTVSKRFHYLRMGAYHYGDERFWPLKLINRFKLGRFIIRRADGAGLLGENWVNQPGKTTDLLSAPFLEKIAREWVAFSNYIYEFSQAYPDNFLTVKYEDVRANTLDQIEKIVRLVGADTSTDVMETIISATDFGKKVQGGFFRKGVVGDWAHHFTDKNRRDFNRIAGETLARFGYESDDSWVTAQRKLS